MTDISRDEIREIVKSSVEVAMLRHNQCPAKGLTSEQVTMLAKIVQAVDGTAVVIGRAIVSAFIIGILSLVALGFWHKVTH